MRRRYVGLSILLVLAACSYTTRSMKVDDSRPLLELEHLASRLGPGPQYRLQLYPDGKVTFTGIDFTLYNDTTVTYYLQGERVSSIVALLKEVNYDSMSRSGRYKLSAERYRTPYQEQEFYAPFWGYFYPKLTNGYRTYIREYPTSTTSARGMYELKSDLEGAERDSRLARLEDSLESYLGVSRWTGTFTDQLLVREKVWQGEVQDSLLTLHEDYMDQAKDLLAVGVEVDMRDFYRSTLRQREDSLRRALRVKYLRATDNELDNINVDSLYRIADSLARTRRWWMR